MTSVSTRTVKERKHTHLADLIPQCFGLVVLLIYKIEECKVPVFNYTAKQQYSSVMHLNLLN